jgi:hypothetical protein
MKFESAQAQVIGVQVHWRSPFCPFQGFAANISDQYAGDALCEFLLHYEQVF